ncbi:ABC transporter ATP-binding protein [Krasilnikovia sp. M28-CT-15]|uniref:ATP-binding cassette domain-containing protein n=1 Tax=Krasilnikovia sp. M28-CT-15 TaxID=3373540 RepID=UPI003875FA3B
MANRAEFTSATRRIIAERAGYQCSVLNCGRLTVGPGTDPRQTVHTGVAAHIYSAAKDGPRGTGGLSDAERREPENGIWCCAAHGRSIDADDGRVFPAVQLRAWKRLHEARKAAEVNGGAIHHVGLVESIAVHSAPAAGLEGRTFELGMRNIFTGPNASGKSILTRLIASVAHPDHVADMSRDRDVDMGVRWFDPMTHDVATAGRGGIVTHVLDGRPVPYVARPYKTILLNGQHRTKIGNLTSLAQMFDLNIAAMSSVLALAADQGGVIKDVQREGMRMRWTVDVDGRIESFDNYEAINGSLQTLILLELAGLHARHHARAEPTFLLLDEFLDFHNAGVQVEALQRLQAAAEHAQVAIVSHSPVLLAEAPCDWAVTELAPQPQNHRDNPLAYDIATKPPDA